MSAIVSPAPEVCAFNVLKPIQKTLLPIPALAAKTRIPEKVSNHGDHKAPCNVKRRCYPILLQARGKLIIVNATTPPAA